MAQLRTLLQSLNAYPVPLAHIEGVAVRRGLDLDAEATKEAQETAEYRLVCADIYLWLSAAPNVSQGGQSYTIDSDQRTKLRSRAMAIYRECGEDAGNVATYGYKGSRL